MAYATKSHILRSHYLAIFTTQGTWSLTYGTPGNIYHPWIATSWICSMCTLLKSLHLFLKRTFSLQLHVFPYKDNFSILLVGDVFISLLSFQSSFSLGFVHNHSVATTVNPTQEQILTFVWQRFYKRTEVNNKDWEIEDPEKIPTYLNWNVHDLQNTRKMSMWE